MRMNSANGVQVTETGAMDNRIPGNLPTMVRALETALLLGCDFLASVPNYSYYEEANVLRFAFPVPLFALAQRQGSYWGIFCQTMKIGSTMTVME